MAIDYRGLRSLTAQDLIAALIRDGLISFDKEALISATATRMGDA
jgi:hypothetical protein